MSGNKQDMGAPAVPSGSRASHEAATHLHPLGFDPSRLLRRLRRMEALAQTPGGQFTGPVFDEIAALAASCIATIGGGDANE